MKKNIWIWLIVFCFSACLAKVHKDDFTIKPSKNGNNNISLKIRINGAYYSLDNKDDGLDIVFLYNNNLQRNIAADKNHFNKNDISGSINKILQDFNNAKNKNQYFEDGGYKITDSIITFQSLRYMPQFNWGIVIKEGKFLNDSTILITKFYFPREEIYQSTKHYHFIETNKPDSLEGNRWKNEKWYWAD